MIHTQVQLRLRLQTNNAYLYRALPKTSVDQVQPGGQGEDKRLHVLARKRILKILFYFFPTTPPPLAAHTYTPAPCAGVYVCASVNRLVAVVSLWDQLLIGYLQMSVMLRAASLARCILNC